MLKELHIRNFALAEKLHLEFAPGLNILTGETGAGKSIIVGAISAVLGGRVFTEVVRTGADKAIVEAIFDINHLEEVKQLLGKKGLDDHNELFLRREISVKGNTRAFVNDVPVTIGTLAEIGDLLVDIHGQSEHQSLLRREIHRYFLDEFGRLHPLLEQVQHAFTHLTKTRNALTDLQTRQKELTEKYEFYRFQLNEINQAQLKPGEDEELEQERKLLSNSERIFQLTGEFTEMVNGNFSPTLQEMMAQAEHILGDLSQFSRELSAIHREFSSARIVVEEAARSVEEFRNSLEFNPLRLEEIEQRLATISSLKKKYGATIEEILQFRDTLKKELELKENFEFELEKLHQAFQQARTDYLNKALELSRQRKQVARKLEKAVEQLLKELGMEKTRFRVHFELPEDQESFLEYQGKRIAGTEWGLDQIEFYISPNPGEDFKPLVKIASGGEISRIMLALKSILAEVDRVPLLIFDEIDTGVSGRIARAVGNRIGKLAETHQILCITHLPQIASFGNVHFRVEKFVEKGRTFTRVVSLHDDQRVEEIASLMAGQQISESILESARQLLEEANQIEGGMANK